MFNNTRGGNGDNYNDFKGKMEIYQNAKSNILPIEISGYSHENELNL